MVAAIGTGGRAELSSYSVVKFLAIHILIQCTQCEILLMLTPITETYIVSFHGIFTHIAGEWVNETETETRANKCTTVWKTFNMKIGRISTDPMACVAAAVVVSVPSSNSNSHCFVRSHTPFHDYNYPISTISAANSLRLLHDYFSFVFTLLLIFCTIISVWIWLRFSFYALIYFEF